MALTATMLLVVLSGYVGRHLMKQISLEVNEKKALLTRLESAYRETAGELAAHPEEVALLRPWSGFWGTDSLHPSSFRAAPPAPAAVRAVELAESMADVEYAIKTHETLRRWFVRLAPGPHRRERRDVRPTRPARLGGRPLRAEVVRMNLAGWKRWALVSAAVIVGAAGVCRACPVYRPRPGRDLGAAGEPGRPLGGPCVS